MEPQTLFEIDTDGWIAQHSGRPLTEVIREILQNALDTEEDITVKIDTRAKQVEVIDDGPGFDNLANAWQVFGGDKAHDPEKRGRFGRGLKETAASAAFLMVETTGGRVEFDVENRERHVYPEEGRDSGTRILARNPDWKMRDVKDVYEYVETFWPPAGQTVTVDLKGGNTEEIHRPEPTKTERMYLPTVVVNDNGSLDREKRTADVHVRPAGRTGVLYEMGIPIERETDYPFHVDVQQKVPLAEQRNEPDSSWHERYLIPGLLEAVIDDLSDTQIRKPWAVNSIARTYKSSLKETFVEKVVEDGRKRGLVVSSGEAADDKCQNYGYQVFDTDRAGGSVAQIVSDVRPTAIEVAKDLEDREKKRVSPTGAQRSFIAKMEGLARDIGFDQVSIETWSMEQTFVDQSNPAEYHEPENVIRLNVDERAWDMVTPENVGIVLHELAHVHTSGHGNDFQTEVQNIAGKAIVGLMEDD